MSSVLQVLVVDDESASRENLAEAIESYGYDCRTAEDGFAAWEMHRERHADVILSDWDMPRMDGLTLCKRTRVADEKTYTYFIFMTAFQDKEHFLRGMEAGADDYQTKPIDLDELRARLVSAERVVSLYRKLAEQNASLRHDSEASFSLARVDALTGAANRLRLEEDLRMLGSRAGRYGHRYSVALFDIDWFKAYNDHYGHLAGDATLRRVSQTIGGELRAGDGLYRYGGEEFLVVFPEQSLAEAAHAAERMRRAVAAIGASTVASRGAVTVSVGVAELAAGEDLVAGWLGRADAALYRAKASGRNRVEIDGPPGSSRRGTSAAPESARHSS